MIKVNIIALGRLKEKYLKDAVEEYSKRLSRYCSLKIIELEPERLPDNPSPAQIFSALEKEAVLIRAARAKRACNIAMCIEGKQLSSEKLSAEFIKIAEVAGNVNFIIGSSYGLDEGLKRECELQLSMSEMTFPHQLARVMLLEQIYRAFKINEGSAYHK